MPNGIKLHICPLLRIKHYALSIFNNCALCIVNYALIPSYFLSPNSYLEIYFIYIARIKSVQSSNVANVSDSGIIPGIIPNLRIIFIG